MDSALQADLARPNAPAEQVMNSALGQFSSRPECPPDNSRSAQEPNDNEKPSVRGRNETTSKVRLAPKSSHDRRSQSRSTQEEKAEKLELGSVDDVANAYTLQPVDEGFGAWSYVASAFAMFIVVWGFPQSFPMFQTYLSSGESAQYSGSVVLTLLAPGLQDIEEGILFQILPQSASNRPKLVVIGITIIIVSLILASFATKAWQIFLTQGVLYGIGGIFLNFVHVSIFPEWFDKRKGQAMGIIWLGYRLGGLVFPLICQWLLERHGYQKTLRVMIAPMLALLLPSIVLFRGRYSVATVVSKPTQPAISKIQALKTPNVLYYLIVALLFSFVTNVPMMFITRYGSDLHLSSSDQALALSLVFASSMLSTYILGRLSDKVFRQGLMGGSAVSTSMIHFLIWGFAKSKYIVFVYAFCIGLTSGGFRNCLFTFFSEVCGSNNELFTAIHSLFSFFEGVTILSVGPIGSALLSLSPRVEPEEYAIGKYKYLVAYAGSMTMASGLLVLVPLSLSFVRSTCREERKWKSLLRS